MRAGANRCGQARAGAKQVRQDAEISDDEAFEGGSTCTSAPTSDGIRAGFRSVGLQKIEDLIHEARMRGHLTDDNVNDLQRQVRRTSAPLAPLLRYLPDNPDRG